MKKLVKRAAPTGEGNGAANFLKIVDGQSVTGVFRGEIAEFWQVWPKGGTKQIFLEPTAGATTRFRVNFVTREDGKAVAKVWEFATTVYNMLADIQEDFDLETTTIKITRRGTGKNTSWTLIPLGPLDAKGVKAVAAIELNSLGIAPTADAEEKADDSSEVPF